MHSSLFYFFVFSVFSVCFLFFELVVALPRLHDLPARRTLAPVQTETQSQRQTQTEMEIANGRGTKTTRCAYKIYFVNKVNAITNKLDFVPCFLYFVAGLLHFWPRLELLPPLGNRSTAPRGRPWVDSSLHISALPSSTLHLLGCAWCLARAMWPALRPADIWDLDER